MRKSAPFFTGISFLLLIFITSSAHAVDELKDLGRVKAQDFGNVKTTSEEKSSRVQNAEVLPLQARKTEKLFRFRPYFKQGFRLTNNVFHDPNGEKVTESTQRSRKMDAIWTETPGISASYQKGSTLIGATYEADFQYFTKYSGQNAQNQTVGGIVLFKPSDKTYVRITEDFSQKELTSSFINLKPVKVSQNDMQVSGGYKLDRLTVETGYRNYVRNFHSDVSDPYDYYQNEYSITGYYQATDALKPFLRTKLIQVDYSHAEEPRDAIAFDNRVGFMSAWRDKGVEIQGDAGFYLRDQRHSNDVNDPDYFVASLLARKTIGKKSVLETGFYREPREATFRSTTTYIENALYFGASHSLTKKLAARGNLIGSWQRYPDAASADSRFMKRHDSSLGINFGFDYVFNRHAALRTDYRLDRRNSNFHDFDYTENSLLSKLILTL